MLTTISPNLTRNTLAANRVIAAGSLIVYGWSVTSDSSTLRTVELQDADGNVYQEVEIGPGNTTGAFYKSNIPFLAANGLTVAISAADANVRFTVFHSNPAGAA